MNVYPVYPVCPVYPVYLENPRAGAGWNPKHSPMPLHTFGTTAQEESPALSFFL